MKKIGIIIAMDKELAPFLDGGKYKKENVKNLDFYHLKIGKKECVIVKSGVGKVNAAYATTVLLSKYDVETLVSTGISGGLGENKILSLVAADKCVQYDVDTTALGDPLGFVSTVNKIFFEADKGLTDDFCQKTGAKKAILASGDKFVADKNTQVFLKTYFDAGACDMESGAIAQAAYIAKVPFVVIRCISDGADDDAALTFEEMTDRASKILSDAVTSWIESL